MRVFLGGAEQEEVLDRDDDALAALALREVRTMMTIDAEPLFTRVFRFNRASPQPHLGHLGRIRDLRAKLSEIPSAFGDSGGTGAKPPLPAPAGATAASSAMSAPAGTTGFGLNRTAAGIL